VGALASGRGGVVMSNEHSASLANLRWRDLDVNHQWSKSWGAEQLMAEALSERVEQSSSWPASCAIEVKSGSRRNLAT